MICFNSQTPIFKRRGFTLVEVLVGTFLILIVFLGLFGAYQLGLKVVGQSKNKVIATELANGELEKIRNLPYHSIGIKDGVLPVPDGILDATTIVIRNNIEYRIERQIKYIVDAADGIGGADLCDWDYKRVEIKVSWSGQFKGEVKLVTDVAPKDKVEEIAACSAQPGGILSVSVSDAYGLMVPSPSIEIINPATGELLDSMTPPGGKQDFPLGANTYKVVVSKSGYSTERTYGTDEIATPAKPHPIVLEGELTEISFAGDFAIDKLSSLTIETRGTKGAGYPPIHNVTFTLTGAKLIGIDSDENPVYKYSQNHITNGPGQILISNLEWDSYSFSIVTPDLDLTGFEFPLGTESDLPFGLPPDSSSTVRLILKAENSLLVTVQDIETLEPIFLADVKLYKSGLDYGEPQWTNEQGQTYFIPLEAADYTIEVKGPDYSDYFGTLSISGDETKIINLQRFE